MLLFLATYLKTLITLSVDLVLLLRRKQTFTQEEAL